MHRKTLCLFSLVTLLIVFIVACDGGGMKGEQLTYRDLKTMDSASLQRLSHKSIFFGHQSVGGNILEGIKGLSKEYPSLNLCLKQVKSPIAISSSCLTHAEIGSNGDGFSKIKAFAQAMTENKNTPSDIAFFKFCYIDIQPDTDVHKLFQAYREAMERLREQFPRTTFVHVTAPLETSPGVVKRFIKSMLGRSDANIKREEYNQILRNHYRDREPLFDLALIESTRMDGSFSIVSDSKVEYKTMATEYTDDGGHLNALGRKHVAEKLLLFLFNLG